MVPRRAIPTKRPLRSVLFAFCPTYDFGAWMKCELMSMTWSTPSRRNYHPKQQPIYNAAGDGNAPQLLHAYLVGIVQYIIGYLKKVMRDWVLRGLPRLCARHFCSWLSKRNGKEIFKSLGLRHLVLHGTRRDDDRRVGWLSACDWLVGKRLTMKATTNGQIMITSTISLQFSARSKICNVRLM